MRVTEQILDVARWAPSGDNTQPWRFEIKDENEVVIHGHDTREHCVYDLDGHPSQIAVGALLESISIAATQHGLRSEISRKLDQPDAKPIFTVRFIPDPAIAASPLAPSITVRSVQRRPLSTKPLTPEQKSALQASVGVGYQLIWFESFAERWRAAQLMFRNAKLRLTMPEAYEVHRSIIQWDAQFSEDKVPDQAIGVDPMTARVMRWTMHSWQRVDFFNTWMAGTLAPRLQLDLIPGLACAAHIALIAAQAPVSIDDYVAGGRAVQRLWLEVTRNNLWLQPEMTPVIFGRYQRERIPFTKSASCRELAAKVASGLGDLVGNDLAPKVVFLARLGSGNAPRARSTRIPLSGLMLPSPAARLDAGT